MIIQRLLSFRYNSRQKGLSGYLRSIWGVPHAKIGLFEQALRHKSIVGTGRYASEECNERLELLGDAVLDTVVTHFLFKRYPHLNEGQLTKIRSRIVNREMLASIGYKCELDKHLECSIGNDDSIDKIVGNAFEAWIGAIYLDQGFHKVRGVIEGKLLLEWIDIESVVETTSDFKSKLIEWVQKNKHRIRFHTQMRVNGETDFLCEISVNGELVASGVERSKKRAEQVAAKKACKSLNLQ